MFEHHRPQFDRVRRIMSERVPGVSKVEAKATEDGRLVLRFQDGSFKDPFIARYVSDGTIKMFAYLVLLYDPKPHPLLAVEEPENQLHPELMHELVEEFRDHARRGSSRERALDEPRGVPAGGVLLQGAARRFVAPTPDLQFLCVAHEGKQDLEKSIPRKLQNWREPGVRFVIVRDNDGGDCRSLKERLVAACEDAGRSDSVVRLACQELEAWYLGDPDALARAFEDEALAGVGKKSRFRDPDSVAQPSAALAELAPAFQKVSGARAMAAFLDPGKSSSRSFRVFVEVVERLAGDVRGRG